VLLDYQT